jgi:hypothetical protein
MWGGQSWLALSNIGISCNCLQIQISSVTRYAAPELSLFILPLAPSTGGGGLRGGVRSLTALSVAGQRLAGNSH